MKKCNSKMRMTIKLNSYLTGLGILLSLCVFAAYYASSNFSFVLVPNTTFALPNLSEGDLAIVAKKNRVNFQYGDLYAFKAPNDDIYVMRLIGKPGDQISSYNNNVFVNEEVLDRQILESQDQVTLFSESFSDKNYQVIVDSSIRPNIHDGTWSIGDNSYFFLGDNRSLSQDSRLIGSIEENQVIGPVSFILKRNFKLINAKRI